MDKSQNTNKRFAYFYFHRNEPEKIKQVVSTHVQFWKVANLKNYMGGHSLTELAD